MPRDAVKPETFANRTAVYGWLFAAFYVSGLVAMTHVTVRDGAPPGGSLPVIIGLMTMMWIAGLGFAAYTATRPWVIARVSPGAGVQFTQRHPHKVVIRTLDAAKVRPATMVTDKDSEGSPYHVARVRSLDGGQWDIAEGHSREAVQRACDRFNRALTTRLASAPDWTMTPAAQYLPDTTIPASPICRPSLPSST